MTKVGVVGGRGHCSVCATSPVWWEGGATARCVPPPLWWWEGGATARCVPPPPCGGRRGHCSVCATSPVGWEGRATARCVPPPPCGGRVGPLLGVCHLPRVVGGRGHCSVCATSPRVVGGRGHCSVCATSPVWWEAGPLLGVCHLPRVVGGWGHCSGVCHLPCVVVSVLQCRLLHRPQWKCTTPSPQACCPHRLRSHYLFNLRDISKVRCVEGEGQDVCDCGVCAPRVFVHMYACMHVGWVVGGSLCIVAPPPPTLGVSRSAEGPQGLPRHQECNGPSVGARVLPCLF